MNDQNKHNDDGWLIHHFMKATVRTGNEKLGCAQLYKMKYLQKFLTSPIDLFK